MAFGDTRKGSDQTKEKENTPHIRVLFVWLCKWRQYLCSHNSMVHNVLRRVIATYHIGMGKKVFDTKGFLLTV